MEDAPFAWIGIVLVAAFAAGSTWVARDQAREAGAPWGWLYTAVTVVVGIVLLVLAIVRLTWP